jgi:YVTN family beta-propeller protein
MKSSLRICAAVIFAILAGCAAPQKKELPAIFFPSPPLLPRIQFLTSFNGAKDVEPEKSGFEKFVVGEKENPQRLDKPYGIAVRDGKVYVCDTNQTVEVFDFAKKTYGPLEGAQGLGKLVQPINISIDAEGNKYVTDPVRGQVVVYGKDDQYVKAFGNPRKWKPVDAVPYGDRLYVADSKNARVVVLDKTTGKELMIIGRSGEPAAKLYIPTNLSFDSRGVLYVSDMGKFEIVKYDRDGHYLGGFGKLGTYYGQFVRPKGITADRQDRLYVVDAAFDNVQVFGEGGKPLLFVFGSWGEYGRYPGNFYLPAKVVINYDSVKYFQRFVDPKFEVEYLIFVTSQFGDRMVSVFGYGKEKGKNYPTDAELYKEYKEQLEKELREKAGEVGGKKK